jgi:tmRNA-binding protein
MKMVYFCQSVKSSLSYNKSTKFNPSLSNCKLKVYAWIGQRSIPYHKKGKKLMFLKSEIDSWLKEGSGKPETVALKLFIMHTNSFVIT